MVEEDSLFVVHLLEQEKAESTSLRYESKETKHVIHPFQFDPNTIDSTKLTALGLSDFVVRNILKYRAKGGHYKTAEQFGRTYGLDSADFAVLLPFISIAESHSKPEGKQVAQEDEPFLTVLLNDADSALLCQLKGIGPYRAKAIVIYRNQLGGFVSASQLLEIKKFPEAVVNDIAPHLIVDKSKIRKLRVNTATVERLKSHPYLSYYQAKAITELRREKRHIDSIEDLRPLNEFSDSDLLRLEPYLSFE
ncbi:MAG: helix-hairpin-helix domain-containing protein [Paludibacteraceae bacterium]|nr:helix-hairpin-helix domain-containing protein [Paludibacteraceae bacterium]